MPGFGRVRLYTKGGSSVAFVDFTVQKIYIMESVDSFVRIFQISIHPSIYCSMGSAPVSAQCPLTYSLGEFLGYWDWVWSPGLSPVLVSIALPFPFHISVFSIHSSSPATGFHSSIFNGGGICTPPPTLLLIPDLGLALW